MKKRNRAVDFFRFLFCCIVFILHFRDYGSFESENGQFHGGYLAVEFFFIVSGFLMMKKAEACMPKKGEEGKQAFLFLVERYKKLYPYYFLSIILCIVSKKLTDASFSIKTAILKGFPDIFAVQIFWRPYSINTHFWFVSGLLWASFLVYYLVIKNKDTFVYIIEPISLFLFIGLLYRHFKHLDLTGENVLWISGIRAFVEIGLGCFLYSFFKELDKIIGNQTPFFWTVLEIGLLSIILIIMYRTRRDYKDFIMIFLVGAFVLLCFLEKGYLTRALDNKISAFLGSLSYLMYLNQATVTNCAKLYLPHYEFWLAAVVRIVLLAVFSWLELRTIRAIRNLLKMQKS